MDYYLFTARSVTQAQQMAQLLEQNGIMASVQRLPMGLSTGGCAYGVRLGAAQYERALAITRARNVGPLKVFGRKDRSYVEVKK